MKLTTFPALPLIFLCTLACAQPAPAESSPAQTDNVFGAEKEVRDTNNPAKSRQITECDSVRHEPIPDTTEQAIEEELAIGSVLAGRRWPAGMESLLYEHLAQQVGGLGVMSIDSVECDETICEVAFTGTPGNDIDDYDIVMEGLFVKPWNVGSGSFGGHYVAPGIKGLFLRISNVPMTPERLRQAMQPECDETVAE